MKQFLHNHGLFAALLTASLVGHVSVKWLGPVVALDPQMAQVESGRNSVSVQLIAVEPQVPDAAEIELPDPLPPDRSHLTEPPAPVRETDVECPRRSPSSNTVVAAVETAFPLEAASDQTVPNSQQQQRRTANLQDPRTEQRPNEVVRRRRERDIETASEEIEVPSTVMSQESVGEEVPPSFASRPLPLYPADLLLQQIEGTVELLVTIGADGRVAKATLHRSSGYAAMDRSALKTIYRWTFSPARRGDTPIAKRAIVPIDFTIQR